MGYKSVYVCRYDDIMLLVTYCYYMTLYQSCKHTHNTNNVYKDSSRLYILSKLLDSGQIERGDLNRIHSNSWIIL